MKRLFPPVRLAAGYWQLPARKQCGPSLSPSCHSPLAISHGARGASAALTLIELLVVVAIVAVLAGLTLATLGGVQKKSVVSRAQAEVAAVTAAIDSYFLDNGVYPPMDPGTNNSTAALYAALAPPGSGKVYLEAKPAMLQTNGTQTSLIDPWGDAYRYNTNPAQIRNVGSFDFWSEAGTKDTTTDDVRN